MSLGGMWEGCAFPVPVIWLGGQAEPTCAYLLTKWDKSRAPCIPVSFWVGWKFWDLARARAGEIRQIQGENIAKSVLGLCLI